MRRVVCAAMSVFEKLDALPRRPLAQLPTPLEPMANLEQRFDNVRLFIKRDDCTGLAMGGNKLRQLEFYFGEAVRQEADTVLITGAVQSNFVRLAAASANKLGMHCHIQLEQRVAKNDPLYANSGNVLLDRMLGATMHTYPHGEDEAGADAQLESIADELRVKGCNPYIIHLAPGHPPIGALGYVDAAREIMQQATDEGITIDEVIVPSGSGHTHGGLLFGLRAWGATMPVTGICVRRDAGAQHPRIVERTDQIADLLGVDNPVGSDDVVVIDEFLKPGYGQLNDPTRKAIALAARTEGALLDPVYSGKTMAGCLASASRIEGPRTILFIHTGGTPAIFAYQAELSELPD